MKTSKDALREAVRTCPTWAGDISELPPWAREKAELATNEMPIRLTGTIALTVFRFPDGSKLAYLKSSTGHRVTPRDL